MIHMALFLSVLMKSVTEVGIAYVEIMTKTINKLCYACYAHKLRYFSKFKDVWTIPYGFKMMNRQVA